MKKALVCFAFVFALSAVGYAQKVEWARYTSNASTSCIAVSHNDSLIFVGTDFGRVLAFDRYSQNQIWSFDFGKSVQTLDVSRDGERVLVSGVAAMKGSQVIMLRTSTGAFLANAWSSAIDTERITQALFSGIDSAVICTNMGSYIVDYARSKVVLSSNTVGQFLITPDYYHLFFYNSVPVYDTSVQNWYGVLQDLKTSKSCRLYGRLYGDQSDVIVPRGGVVSPDGSQLFCGREIFDSHTGQFDTSIPNVSGRPVFLSNNRFAYIAWESSTSNQTNILITRDLQTRQILGRLDSVITIPVGLTPDGQLIASNDGNSIYWNSSVLERIAVDSDFSRTVYTTEILSNPQYGGGNSGELIWYPSVLLDSSVHASELVLFGGRPDGVGARNDLVDVSNGSLSYLNSKWRDYATGQRMIYGLGHESRDVLDIQTGKTIHAPLWNGFMSPDDSTFAGQQGIDSLAGVIWHYMNHGRDSVAEYQYAHVASVLQVGGYNEAEPHTSDTLRSISYSLIDFSRDGKLLLASDSVGVYTIDPANFHILSSVRFPKSNFYYSQASDRLFAYDTQDSMLYSIAVADIPLGTAAIVKRQMPIQINTNLFCDVSLLFVTDANGWSALDPATLQTVEREEARDLMSFAISADHQHAITLSKDGVLQSLQTTLQALFLRETTRQYPMSLISYPNPATNEMKIVFTLNEPSRVSVTIFSVAGTVQDVISSGFLSAGLETLDIPLTNYAPGPYFARVTIDGDCSSQIGVCSYSVK